MPMFGRMTAHLVDYRNQHSLGARLRARRSGPLMRMIEAAYQSHGHVDILDVGGTPEYWGIIPRPYLEQHRVTIAVLNLPGLARPRDDGPFRFLEGNGCHLGEIADRAFHIAHSNSVLEHVGDWRQMTAFAGEIYRVAPRSFVQTPNFWFPVEPHYMTPCFHWLPKATQVWLVRHFQLGTLERAATVDRAVRTVESASLVSRAMFRALFPESRIVTERVLGLPKSLIAIKD